MVREVAGDEDLSALNDCVSRFVHGSAAPFHPEALPTTTAPFVMAEVDAGAGHWIVVTADDVNVPGALGMVDVNSGGAWLRELWPIDIALVLPHVRAGLNAHATANTQDRSALIAAVTGTGTSLNDAVDVFRLGDVAIVADDAQEIGFLLRLGIKTKGAWTVVSSFDENAPGGVVAKHRSRAMRLPHAPW